MCGITFKYAKLAFSHEELKEKLRITMHTVPLESQDIKS
jgi:hypothetical protein